jgi:TfoX/Sxy family transcriptional regulator of competence genes
MTVIGRPLRDYPAKVPEMQPGAMPKPSQEAKESFLALVPDDPVVTTKPMFGNLAAFVNGNMFTGLFGEGLFVRLSEEDLAEARKRGAQDFEPMPGRAMKGYVLVPGSWREQPEAARGWIDRSLAWAATLPPREPKAKVGKRR